MSRISIVGLFAVLTFLFTLPILVVFVQQQQQLASKAANPTAAPLPPTPSGFIAGYVFHDDNRNGVRDPEEKPFSNISVTITAIAKGAMGSTSKVAQVVSNSKTDSNGYFFYNISGNASALEFAVRVIPPDGYKTIDTNPVLFSTITAQSKELLQVGLFPLK